MNRLMFATLLGLSLSPLTLHAHTLEGVVKDSKTGSPLIGSYIEVKEYPNVKATTGLDGTFKLKGLPDKGSVTLVCHYLSYETKEMKVDASDANNVTIPMVEEGKMLNEVTVTGVHDKRSDRSAIGMEKNASNVLNVMSAQSIQIAPDVNVASVLQRVSGVTMEKDASGEATYAILRGMDKRYNYTLVNGVKIPSPDDQNRYVPLNIFPSDLMDRIVVSKSLTADMEGDATGGVVDMVMKDAPAGFQLQANAAAGYSDYFMNGHDYLSFNTGKMMDKAPYEKYGSQYDAKGSDFENGSLKINSHRIPAPNFIGGLSLGNRFFDGKLGLLIAGSLQNLYRGTDRTFYGTDMASGAQAMYVSSGEHRLYSIHEMTGGIHGKADLQLGNHKFEWYNMYVNMASASVRHRNTIGYAYGYDPVNGDYTLNQEVRTMRETQSIFATHLKGTHQLLPSFKVDWSGLFSRAKANDPDRTYVSLTNDVKGNKITKTSVDNSGNERRFQHNTDKDWAGYINLTYDSKSDFADFEWKGGAMYRKKERESRYYSYQFRAADGYDVRPNNSILNLDEIQWDVRTPRAQASQLNYDSKEHIGAAYGMLRMSNHFGELVAGFRAEHTNQIYRMLQHFDDLGPVGEQSYWDYLPSVSLKYTPTNKMNVRLSYYRSINRPGFFEIVPYQLIGEEYSEAGNTSLKRARIDNYDLRWEWFPSSNEQIFVGLFYKYLQDPIEQSFGSPYPENDKRHQQENFYMPQNLGNAKNYGVEIDVIKYIRHFGIKANYTYTHSSITTPKKQFVDGKKEPVMVNQTRSLVNQAPHTANLSLLYKDTKYGWNAQLAGAYTGKRIAVVSPYKDADQWDKAAFSLDLSAEKNFNNGISVFLKANNLLDTKNERYINTVDPGSVNLPGQRSDRTVVGTYKYGRTFLLGLRYTLDK